CIKRRGLLRKAHPLSEPKATATTLGRKRELELEVGRVVSAREGGATNGLVADDARRSKLWSQGPLECGSDLEGVSGYGVLAIALTDDFQTQACGMSGGVAERPSCPSPSTSVMLVAVVVSEALCVYRLSCVATSVSADEGSRTVATA